MVHPALKQKEGVKMKKASLLLLIISLLMVYASCFAEPRAHDWVSEGESDFTNLGVSGVSDGAPGYVKLTGRAGEELYLWVGTDGVLRMASPLALSYSTWGQIINDSGITTVATYFLGATPALVNWEDASGVVVGTQVGTSSR